jgi:HPt (histidine-containing phosphotransfer) domain-containing protein
MLLDAAAGLQSFGGMRSSYERMLRRFPALHRWDAVQFRDALDTGDTDSARRIVHTLKGVAATLGAQVLRAEALACEEWLVAGAQTRAEDPAERLFAALAQTIDAIQQVYPPEQALASVSPVSTLTDEQAAERMSRLEWLLAHDDMRSSELWQELQAWCLAEYGEQAVSGLTRAIQDFDFPTAIEQLRELQAHPAGEQVH